MVAVGDTVQVWLAVRVRVWLTDRETLGGLAVQVRRREAEWL